MFGTQLTDQQKVDQAALGQLSAQEIEQLSGITFGLFGGYETGGLPKLPGVLGPDSQAPGTISVEDRNRIRKMQRVQRMSAGRQGTVLGGGIPTQSTGSSASKTVLGA